MDKEDVLDVAAEIEELEDSDLVIPYSEEDNTLKQAINVVYAIAERM